MSGSVVRELVNSVLRNAGGTVGCYRCIAGGDVPRPDQRRLLRVGLLTTIGLSAKNAILIVEFAKDLMDKEGKGLIEATLDAVRMRLRPILMTSLAFILGVMPLVISSGAGSGAQNAVGTGVMGGMVTATVLAIFFVPVFFVVVRRRFSRKNEDIEHSHSVEHH